jgi:hypothetical protein
MGPMRGMAGVDGGSRSEADPSLGVVIDSLEESHAGFGVLTEIDIEANLKSNIGAEAA